MFFPISHHTTTTRITSIYTSTPFISTPFKHLLHRHMLHLRTAASNNQNYQCRQPTIITTNFSKWPLSNPTRSLSSPTAPRGLSNISAKAHAVLSGAPPPNPVHSAPTRPSSLSAKTCPTCAPSPTRPKYTTTSSKPSHTPSWLHHLPRQHPSLSRTPPPHQHLSLVPDPAQTARRLRSL